MTFKALPDEFSLSEGSLGQLESGRLNAGPALLQRITRALGTKVAEMSDESSTSRIRLIRTSERFISNIGARGRRFLSRTLLDQLEAAGLGESRFRQLPQLLVSQGMNTGPTRGEVT